MVIKKGDQFKCLKTITNMLGWVLYEKDKTYTVISMNDNNDITLNHVLYANEYQGVTKEYIFNNFKKV